MRKLLILAAVLAVPTISSAQVSLGLRLGFAPARGDVAEDLSMRDGVKSQIPVQLDALYHLNKELAVGAYASYGFGQLNSSVADACDLGDVDCSARSLRFGVQAAYTFHAVDPKFVPWAGAGIGYEISSFSEGDEDTTFSGFELLNLQVGADYGLTPQFSVGPYLQYSVGRYSSIDDGTESVDIEEKAFHSWIGFGVRGKFSL